MSAIDTSSTCAAQKSGVLPSPCGVFGLAPRPRTARTAAASFFRIADTSGESPAPESVRVAAMTATAAAAVRLERQDLVIHPARTVADVVYAHAELIEQRQVQVGERR